MSTNVHDRISDQKPSLVERMCSNTEVSSTVMAYLNLLIGISLKMGYPITGVRIDPLVECEPNTFKAKVHFYRFSSGLPRIWGTTSNFVDYARAKAGYLAAALQRNPGLERWFESMVDTLDNWSKARNIPFEVLSIKDPIVTRDMEYLTFKVGRRLDIV